MSVLGTAVMGNMESVERYCEDSQVNSNAHLSKLSVVVRSVVRQAAECKANLPGLGYLFIYVDFF